MWLLQDARNLARALFVALLVIGVGAAGVAGGPGKPAGPRPDRTKAAVAADTASAGDLEIRGTPDNLQDAFTNEMNAKARYEAFAMRADQEGLPDVARLFRACAQAEQAHADRLLHAIAWTGRPARALLDRLNVASTAENLRLALSIETWEANRYYPAVIARARAEHWNEAVRAMTFALSAEREHVQLLQRAIDHLGGPTAGTTYWVCPYCGRTVDALGFHKCPTCYTSAHKFIRIS